MAIKVSSFEDVSRLIAGNPLRNFPSQSKGRDRLFPVPRPRISTNRTIPADASFFCIGACFARGVEKALTSAGRKVLSSRTGLGLPGSVEEQFSRYNVFNLDVGMNEVRWALGAHEAPWDAPLVKVGENHTDLQLHWAFAHPEDEARDFRKLYNDSFKPIVDADVIVLAVAGIRQWFDRETGIYINSMPPAALVRTYPGRFEMHEFDVEGCAERLESAIRIIRENCPRDPLILVAVAPVWQPMSTSAGDALVDQMKVKATQRVAVEKVCATHEGVEYLPALENAMLGDFRYGFLDNSPNHTSQHLAERVVADMIQDFGADDSRHAVFTARAHAEAAIMAGDPARAVALCETVAEMGAASAEFSQVYSRALVQSGRISDAVNYLVDALESGVPEQPQRIWHSAVQIVRPVDTDLIDRLRVEGSKIGADLRYLDVKLSSSAGAGKEVRTAIAEAAKHCSQGDHEAALIRLDQISDKRGTMLPLVREKFDGLVLRALLSAGRRAEAVSRMIDSLKSDEDPSGKMFSQLCWAMRSIPAQQMLPLMDELEAFGQAHFSEEQRTSGPVHSGLERLRTVRKKLELRGHSKSRTDEALP